MDISARSSLVLSLLVTSLLVFTASAADELIVNGDFERGREGWSDFWSRTPGGTATLDAERKHGGRQALRVEHTGSQDWSVSQQRKLGCPNGASLRTVRLAVGRGRRQRNAGSDPVRRPGQGDRLELRRPDGAPADQWQQVRSRFLIPNGAATILPRVIGTGPAKVWLDDAQLRLAGSVRQMRTAGLPAQLAVSNPALEVTLRTGDGTLAVTDRRTKQTWQQRSDVPIIVLDAKTSEAASTCSCWSRPRCSS